MRGLPESVGDGPLTVLVVCRSGGTPQRESILRALAAAGAGVQVVILEDFEACRTVLASQPADLVLVESDVDPALEEFLAARRGHAPPCVVLLREASASVLLQAFRAGADDCIPPGAADAAQRVLVHVGPDAARSDAPEASAAPRSRAGRVSGAIGPIAGHGEKILNHMNSALLVVDAQAHITFANPAAESILRAEEGSLRGRALRQWLCADEGEPGLIERTLAEGKSFRGAEAVLADSQGSRVPIGLSCAPLRDGSERPIGAVAIFQDLSEVKRLQGQVLQSEKMASIGQLASGVAHEINNPMGFIHANLAQVSEYVADLERVWERVEALCKASEQVADGPIASARKELQALADEVDLAFVLDDIGNALRESQEGSERIRHIVQDLRDFARTDGGGPSEADINDCIDSTANIAWSMMKHCVELEKDYGDLPVVRCFPMQLQQVFMNLLVNAYQAIQERVGDSGECGRIVLRTRAQGGGVRVCVRDTGAGIANEHLGRIFEPFFTTKPVGSGTGLGLANSYGIVQRHGGTLSVESEPGRGSCFELWLPLDPAEGEGMAAIAPSPAEARLR